MKIFAPNRVLFYSIVATKTIFYYFCWYMLHSSACRTYTWCMYLLTPRFNPSSDIPYSDFNNWYRYHGTLVLEYFFVDQHSRLVCNICRRIYPSFLVWTNILLHIIYITIFSWRFLWVCYKNWDCEFAAIHHLSSRSLHFHGHNYSQFQNHRHYIISLFVIGQLPWSFLVLAEFFEKTTEINLTYVVTSEVFKWG